ncbi:hypothetical protein IQ781_28050 (plasmid) [Bacillus sp. N447-1]|nr:hypothetical protein [Bacillus sp. N447-1]UNT71686.1 hypothetical protein IQ781_28050 [Bacillus sp. N447-1]
MNNNADKSIGNLQVKTLKMMKNSTSSKSILHGFTFSKLVLCMFTS